MAAASLVALAACGGSGDNQADNDTTTAETAAATSEATPSTATFAPITGEIHVVKMIGDGMNYSYDPAEITIKAGDGIKYVNVSGGPHNVAFDASALPADVRAQLAANMPNAVSELSSPMFVTPNEEYTISFANIKPGTYIAHCTPHLAMNMKQTIHVE